MNHLKYDFNDADKPALAYFDKPLKPMTKAAEVRLMAIKGLAQWKSAVEEIKQPIALDYFFVQMGYSLQVYDKAFWLLRGKK